MNAPHLMSYPPEGPRPLVREIVSGPAYPVASLGPLCAVVEAVQGMTQAPIALPAASALSVASLAVQGFANVETLGGARPVSLFFLTIARSGERKSASDAPLLAALRDHERERAKAQREAMLMWSNAQALWQGERDRILADARKSKGEKRTAAEADLAALGPEPEAPTSTERTVTEPTFEGLSKLLAHGQPSLGLFSDEGGQFLGGHAMNRENRQKTLAGFNKLWQGDPLQRTRSGDGNSTLYGRRLSVHLMVQPTVAYSFMADPLAADTGFLARFLICEPPSAIGTRMHANARSNEQPLIDFAKQLRDFLDKEMPVDSDTRGVMPRLLALEPDARGHLVAYSDAIEAAQASAGNLAHVSGAASKSAEQAARIAGVLTLWRKPEASSVTARDMADGIALAKYYLSEAARLASAAIISDKVKNAESLRRWLLEVWAHPEIMSRDVVRFGPNSLRESPIAIAAINILVEHGWLVRLGAEVVVRGAKRKYAWRIVRVSDMAG